MLIHRLIDCATCCVYSPLDGTIGTCSGRKGRVTVAQKRGLHNWPNDTETPACMRRQQWDTWCEFDDWIVGIAFSHFPSALPWWKGVGRGMVFQQDGSRRNSCRIKGRVLHHEESMWGCTPASISNLLNLKQEAQQPTWRIGGPPRREPNKEN